MKYHRIMLSLFALVFCCGFGWGKSKEQKCEDAKSLVMQQLKTNTDSIPEDITRKVDTLCPEGSAAEFLRGLVSEYNRELARAEQHYNKAASIDEHFADALGRRGLLQAIRKDDEGALVSLSQAMEEGGKDPRYRLALAGLFLKQKMYSLALYQFRRAVQNGAKNDDTVTYGMAQALAGTEQWKEAEVLYWKYMQSKPESSNLLGEFAGVLLKLNRFDEGIQLLKKAVQLEPGNTAFHRKLADAYTAKGDGLSAEAELRAAGITVPSPAGRLVKEGDTLFLKRDYPAAIRAYGAATRQSSAPADTFQKLGDAYVAVGNDEEALKSYRQASKLQPEDAGTHYSIGVILERKGDLDGALVEYERVVVLDRTDGDARRRLAEIHTIRGDLERAISEYRSILATQTDNPVIFFKLARACEKARKYADANKALETAIKLDPANPETRREMALLQTKLGKLDLAEKQYREILALNRNNQNARLGLITSLGRQKKYDQLEQFLKEETEHYPNDATSFYRLGIVNEYLKDYQGAIGAFKQAIAISENARSYKALARVYLRLADRANAREALNMAKKLDPKGREAQDLLVLLDEDERRAERHPVANKIKKVHTHKVRMVNKGKSKGKARKKK